MHLCLCVSVCLSEIEELFFLNLCFVYVVDLDKYERTFLSALSCIRLVVNILIFYFQSQNKEAKVKVEYFCENMGKTNKRWKGTVSLIISLNKVETVSFSLHLVFH